MQFYGVVDDATHSQPQESQPPVTEQSGTQTGRGDHRRPIHPAVTWLASYAWRLLVIACGVVAILWLVGQLWSTFLSLLVALLLWRALGPVAGWLRLHGWRGAPAALGALGGFLIVTVAILALVGTSVNDQRGQIGSTVDEGLQDVEQWLIEGPFNIDAAELTKARTNAVDAATDWLGSSGSSLFSGAVVAGELVVSVVIGLLVTFFALKDGDRFARWAQRLLPEDRRGDAERLAGSAWATIGGYLQGAALLGVVEGLAIGIAVWLAGGELALVVALFTFAMAFIPFVGAFVSGVFAVLVTVATGGTVPALVVLAVVVVVQQLDNDLLSPVIYGKSLDIHPVAVLLSVTAGGSLFGVAGSVLAVPVIAVAVSVGAEALAIRRETTTDTNGSSEAV